MSHRKDQYKIVGTCTLLEIFTRFGDSLKLWTALSVMHSFDYRSIIISSTVRAGGSGRLFKTSFLFLVRYCYVRRGTEEFLAWSEEDTVITSEKTLRSEKPSCRGLYNIL